MEINLSNKKYNIIYADPPYAFNMRKNSKTKFGLGVHGHYPVMKTEEIMDLPIANLAGDNCALFLWTPVSKIDIAINILKAWDFRYATFGFVWVKTNPKKGNWFFGPGYYTANNIEVCLLGIKGSMKPIDNTISQLVISPRREHSRKPDEVRDKIVQLFGDLPKIELFAKGKIPKNWNGWGFEYEEGE